MRRNFREQIVMKLEIMQVYELAPIPSRNIFRMLKISGMGAGRALAIPATYEH